MDPHIVRHIDEELLKRVIHLFQEKDKFTIEEWRLIVQYSDLIMLSTIHLNPDIKEAINLPKTAEDNNEFIKRYETEFDAAFQKRLKFFEKIMQNEQEILPLEIAQFIRNIENNQWHFILYQDLPHYLELSIYNRFWISLFKNINLNDNVLEQIDTRFNNLLVDIIKLAFKDNEEDIKKYIGLLSSPLNYNIVIDAIIKIQPHSIMLSIYAEQRKSFKNDDQPHKLLTTLLHAQQSFYKSNKYHTFYIDAVRATTIEDINIENDLTIPKEAREKITIQKIIEQLKIKQIGNNLIEYILLYVHQHGITQSGTKLLQREAGNFGFAFLFNDKDVRIEILSPTKIRIVCPVLYDKYAELQDPHTRVHQSPNNRPLRYELTSIIIEETVKNSNSLSSINVSTDACFYEILDQELIEKWQVALLKKIIFKCRKEIKLEEFDRKLLEPYRTPSSNLNLGSLHAASPGILVILMMTDYSYAIEIMRNETLRNKILNSEFNIYFFDVYKIHDNKDPFIKNAQNKALWDPFVMGKNVCDRLLKIHDQLIKLQNEKSTDRADINQAITALSDESRSIIAQFKNQKYIYDVLRAYNNDDKIKLLTYPEIASALSVEQFMELVKCSINVAAVLLEPRNISQKDLSNHAINKLSQANLLDIINRYPELWASDKIGFGQKEITTGLFGISSNEGIPYRYLLKPDSLVACVFSDDDKVRQASIKAIADDSKLFDTLFSSDKFSKKIDTHDAQRMAQNLIRFYFDSPDAMQKKIEQLPAFVSYYDRIINSKDPNDKKIVKQFAIPFMKNIPIDALMSHLINLFHQNLATPEIIDKYISVISYHLEHNATRENMIAALVKDPNHLFLFIQYVVSHNNFELYKLLFNILATELDKLNTALSQETLNIPQQYTLNVLAENLFYKFCIESYFTNISNQDLFKLYRNLITVRDKLSQIENSIIANDTFNLLNRVASSPELKTAVMNRIFNNIDRPRLDTADYNMLARLYVSDADWKKSINARPLLLKNIIENANIVLIAEMLKSNTELLHNIIQAFTSNTEMRNRILGNTEPAINTITEISDFITNLSRYIQHENELKSFYQLISACQINPQVILISLAEDHLMLMAKDPKSIVKIFDIEEMSPAKKFIGMPLSDRIESLKDLQKMTTIILTATRAELNVMFSSHPTLLKEWQSKISSHNSQISVDIRKTIIELISETELTKIYLYSDKINKNIILQNELLVDFMLTSIENIYYLYTNDNDMKNIIEKSNDYTNILLASDYKTKQWLEIYLKANYNLRERIIANDDILTKLILMTSQNNLLVLIQAQAELAPKIAQKLFEYYHTTEYMKYLVDLQPKLLNEMLNHLNIKQLTLLLVSEPNQQLLDAIIDNKACCKNILNEDQSKLSHTIPNYDMILSKILIKHPDLKDILQKREAKQKTALPPSIADEIKKTMAELQTKVTIPKPANITKDTPSSGIGKP